MTSPDRFAHLVPAGGVGLIDPALTGVCFLLLLGAAAIGVIHVARRRTPFEPRMIVALAMWLAGTAYLTLRPGHSGRLNLVPFAFGPHPTLFEPLANIFLFVPLGIVISALAWRLPAVLALGFGLSLCIEVTQYVLDIGRTADVNDVMDNTLGVLLGWLVVFAVSRRTVRLTQDPASGATPARAFRRAHRG
jgi:VanZ like family